jgi:hypothetical protein
MLVEQGTFCQRCGANLPRPYYHKQPAPTLGGFNKKVLIGTGAGFGAMLLLIFVVVTTSNRRSRWEATTNTSSTAPAKSPAASTNSPADKSQVSAATHIAEAKKALADGYKPSGKDRSWGRVKDAREHLEEIHQGDKEYAEAQRLLKEVKRREDEIEKWAKATAEKLLADQRKSFADQLETNYLDKGMDVTVSVSGPNNTTIKMKYVLMSRPMVHKLINDSGVISTFRSQGFKKAIFTDGYNDTWTYDID